MQSISPNQYTEDIIYTQYHSDIQKKLQHLYLAYDGYGLPHVSTYPLVDKRQINKTDYLIFSPIGKLNPFSYFKPFPSYPQCQPYSSLRQNFGVGAGDLRKLLALMWGAGGGGVFRSELCPLDLPNGCGLPDIYLTKTMSGVNCVLVSLALARGTKFSLDDSALLQNLLSLAVTSV